MEQAKYTQLVEGYETALDVTEDLANSIAEMQDTLNDTLDDFLYNLKELTQLMNHCCKDLQLLQARNQRTL